MNNLRIFTLFSALLLYGSSAFAADASVAARGEQDNQQIRQLVLSWNEAHQRRNGDLLASLYDSEVDYYGQHLTNAQVVADKRDFFAKNEQFFQYLVSSIHIDDIEAVAVADNAPKASEKQVEFVKQAGNGDRKRNYPATLRVKRVADGQWKIAAESDDISDLNLKQTPYPRVVKGKFDGVHEQYAWVRGQDPVSNSSCASDVDVVSVCTCKLWTSDAGVQPVTIPMCIGAGLSVLPNLDDSGRERLQIIQDWWTSSWSLVRVFDIQHEQWIQTLPTFTTNLTLLMEEVKDQILVTRHPTQPGFARIKETFFDQKTEDLRTEERDKPLLTLK